MIPILEIIPYYFSQDEYIIAYSISLPLLQSVAGPFSVPLVVPTLFLEDLMNNWQIEKITQIHNTLYGTYRAVSIHDRQVLILISFLAHTIQRELKKSSEQSLVDEHNSH